VLSENESEAANLNVQSGKNASPPIPHVTESI